ncbi:MAG TPA: DUF1559 domain-containing protein [Planctomycetaceae bacterium]|jgi:hypothetical protein|nr:DUF1559 domain-containing protein [Planctomycetaceae bacterium]
MRHGWKTLRGDVSRQVLFLGATTVVLAVLCAAGIRGSVAGDDINFGGRPPEARKLTLRAFNQADAPPRDNHISFDDRRKQLEAERNWALDLSNLKLLALAMHNYHDAYKHFPRAVVMGPDGRTPHSWRVELLPFLDQKHLYDQYRMNEPWDSPHNTLILRQMPELFRSPFDNPASKASGYYVIAGPRTIFEGTNGIKIDDIADGAGNTLLIVEAKRDVPWTQPEDIPFDPEKPLPELGGFVAGQFAAAMADGSARIHDAAKTKHRLRWLIMRNDRQTVDENQFVSATEGSLRMLSRAMQKYHGVHGHFPPASVMGPDGKTPHSWRVELLPFIGGYEQLYQRYDQNQPWDSEHNKKLLSKMPAVFRGDWRRNNDDQESTNSSYYVFVGRGTVFEGPTGVKISDITDGTSNTLLIVQAKRDIPWTKPEDIPFDPDKPVSEFRGFAPDHFAGVFADGAVLSTQRYRVKNQLKSLIMRNDGHGVEWWR